MKELWIFITLGCLTGWAHATTDDQAALANPGADSPPNIGNFALPSPDQPGPFLSFGQTLIGKNHLQLATNTFSPYQIGGAFDNVDVSLTYGFTDTTSLYFNYPLIVDPHTRTHHSSSLYDINLQLEHAFFTAGDRNYQEQATLVGAITLPTRDASFLAQRVPITYGAPTYFLGATYNRTYVDWLFFVSPGYLLTTTSHDVRQGSQFLYQAGIGRNIVYVSEQSILFGLVELDGQYTEKNQTFGHNLPNTGGNIIALTPSLSLSTSRFIAQAGVGFPILQQLNARV